jgi:hypothetical protein
VIVVTHEQPANLMRLSAARLIPGWAGGTERMKQLQPLEGHGVTIIIFLNEHNGSFPPEP